MTPARTISLCPWCSAEARLPVGSDDSHHYAICDRHHRAMRAQYAATRHLTRLGRSARDQALERAHQAA